MKEKTENPPKTKKGKKKVGRRLVSQAKEIVFGPKLSQLKGLNNQLRMLKDSYGAMKMANNPYSPLNTQYGFPQYNPLRQEQQISLVRAQTNNAIEKAQTEFNRRLSETQSQFLERINKTENLKAQEAQLKGQMIGEPFKEEVSQLLEEVSQLDPEKKALRREAFKLGGRTLPTKSAKNEYGGFYFTDSQVKKNPVLSEYFKKTSEKLQSEPEELENLKKTVFPIAELESQED